MSERSLTGSRARLFAASTQEEPARSTPLAQYLRAMALICAAALVAWLAMPQAAHAAPKVATPL